jgi:hypothetical protein
VALTQVEFAFSIDQRVKTPFGDIGIVRNLSLDDTSCKKVWVQREKSDSWFKEEELTAIE